MSDDKWFWGSALIVIILMVSSCTPFGPGNTRETKYYMLNSLYAGDSEAKPVADLPKVAIGVGPIRIPRHLDRKEIVTRASQNEVKVDQFALWAGPLSESFSRVIAENLSVLLNTEETVAFPWRARYPIKYQVVIHVVRFDGLPAQEALLRARWIILGHDAKAILFKHQTLIEVPVEAPGMEALVAAKSHLLEKFSDQIAIAIANLEKQGQ